MPRHTSAVVALVAAIAVGLGTRSLRVRSTKHYVETQRYEDVYYLPPAAWLPVLSLGWDEALADLLWMRALVYFGEELRHRGEVAHVFNYADAILTLDPDFKRPYRWIGTVGMYRPVEVSVEEVRRATEYLERAAARFPDDGVIAWDAGASLAFELAPLIDDPDEKARVRGRGVEHMQTAARLGAGPPWLVLTNVTQLQRLGQTEQAIRHLEEMYATTSDPTIREQIEIQLERLRDAAYAEAFRHEYERLERERRENYPYLSPALFELVGPRLSDRPADATELPGD